MAEDASFGPRESARVAAADGGRTLFGHPRGLAVLFLTQTWAEFSYFGLQAMLVYYMTGDLGFSQAKSSLIYGTYGAAAFLSPFFGGIIADRWLGRTKCVIAGGTLMMLGHFAMAFEPLLFPALALVGAAPSRKAVGYPARSLTGVECGHRRDGHPVQRAARPERLRGNAKMG